MANRKRQKHLIQKRPNESQEILSKIKQSIDESENNQIVLSKEGDQLVVVDLDTMTQEEHYFSGPLPAPEVLEKYDKLYPGTAKNFIDDYRKVLDVNIKHSEKIVNSEVFSKNIGSVSSAIFVLGSLGATIVLAFLGQPVPATMTALTGLGSLYFSYLKRDKDK